MRYLLLIYSNEAAGADASPEAQQQVMNEYWAFTEAVNKRGVSKDGEALMPTSTATTVRVKNGKTITSDGPFAETKEQLGGYYLLDVKDLNEAIEIAAMCPGAKYGSIELRPILEFGDAPQ
jgi:hypothetical protein